DHFSPASEIMTQLVQQIPPADGAKACQIAFPDLAQGAGIGALAKGVEDLLVDEQAIECIDSEIFRIELEQLCGDFEAGRNWLELGTIRDDDVDSAAFNILVRARARSEAHGHEAHAGKTRGIQGGS